MSTRHSLSRTPSRSPIDRPALRTLRLRATRAVLAGAVACGGTGWIVGVGTGPANSASIPDHHVPSHARASHGQTGQPGHTAPVLVLVPPYAVYAASRSGISEPARGTRHSALGLPSAASTQSCPLRPARNYVTAHKSSSLPVAVDLSPHDPPVADEGAVHAGAAWATGYTLLGWWSAKQGLAGAPFAPMSVYAQLTGGRNRPASLAAALALERRQGIDTQRDYRHGPTDYGHRPTAVERVNARHYRIAGYACVYQRRYSPFSAQTVVKTVLASGQPLVLGVAVYDNFMGASRAAPFVDLPPRGARLRGAEAVVAVAYDANGVWVQNEWGPRWGLSGYAELSWRFVNGDTGEAWVLSVAPNAAPPLPGEVMTATPIPTLATSTTVSGTVTTPFSGTQQIFPSCGPDGTTPAINTAPYSTSVTPSPTATSDPLVSATAAATATVTAGTPCSPAVSPYPTYPTDSGQGQYPPANLPYPTDANTYPTGAATYPTADNSYPSDILPYLTATATVTPTPSTPTSTPTATPTSTATAAPVPQVADLPTSGRPGSTVTVSGMGFAPGRLDVTFGGVAIGSVFIDGGTFSFPITVAADATPGAATITCANAAANQSAGATFTVVAPPTNTPLPPSPTSIVPAPTVTATATVSPTPTT